MKSFAVQMRQSIGGSIEWSGATEINPQKKKKNGCIRLRENAGKRYSTRNRQKRYSTRNNETPFALSENSRNDDYFSRNVYHGTTTGNLITLENYCLVAIIKPVDPHVYGRMYWSDTWTISRLAPTLHGTSPVKRETYALPSREKMYKNTPMNGEGGAKSFTLSGNAISMKFNAIIRIFKRLIALPDFNRNQNKNASRNFFFKNILCLRSPPLPLVNSLSYNLFIHT